MNTLTKYVDLLDQVKKTNPLVHHITNYVTVNDCANITLAIGGSPIMSDAIEEMEDLTNIASALVLNIGTLNSRTVDSMIKAGMNCNKNNIPVVLDPVGAGASNFRNETTKRILEKVKVSVIRGNISEIKYISGLSSNTRGVDASSSDHNDAEKTEDIALNLAKQMDCVVAITGAIDVISDGKRFATIKNGHPLMSNITGTGCMCTSLIGSFIGANPTDIYHSTITAVMCMGLAGEVAFDLTNHLGLGSYHVGILDAISKLNAEVITERAKISES